MTAANSLSTFDVVVVGGGCAGLVAALAASVNGDSVVLLEKSAALGGTLAWSGGAIWAPANHHELAAGINDSKEKASTYMLGESKHRHPGLVQSFVDTAPQLIEFLEQHTCLQFELGTLPDYQAEAPGGIGDDFAHGNRDTRSLGPLPVNIHILGDQQSLLNRAPAGSIPLGFQDLVAMACPGQFHKLAWQGELGQRIAEGWLGAGEAVAAGLIEALLHRQVDIRCHCRVHRLTVDAGAITGAVYQQQNEQQTVLARKGVILCSGGFEWNVQLRERFLAQDISHPNSPAANEGDGLLMAMKAGAALDNMAENWGWLSIEMAGDSEHEGSKSIGDCLVERAQPHSIIVNQSGQRFANEAEPYSDIFRTLGWKDSTGQLLNLPAYHIFDQQFRQRYSYGEISPADPTPDWIVQANSMAELAEKLSIPRQALEQAITRFNRHANDNRDPDFGRGDHNYDLVYGDRERKGSPTLGPLVEPPFYAVQVFPGSLGTKGGAQKGPNAEVVDLDGQAIAGLYAAGNVSASFSGPAYFGPGATLAEAMVFGLLAANHAHQRESTGDS